ncbi:MAG TPA: M48 family metallopeptidase [Thermoanaerobaculia bacterium]
MNRRIGIPTRPILSVVIALSLMSGVANAQTKIAPGWNLFSPQDDIQIGQQSAVQAEQQLPMLNDPQVQSYVNRIGQRLAQNAGGPQFQYQFKVVNASDINAFALPGGYVYVNRGVLDQARNEGEVAGVIAHEISHVALRHGTHQASKAYAAQAGLSILGGILGGKVGGGTAQVLNAVGGIGLNALFLKYSRDLESQADIRGSQILTASGYAPQDMINFFHTLESVDASRKTNWMSDHPAPPDRVARIQREAQMLHVSASPTTDVAQLNQIKASMSRYGKGPTSAQIAQGVASSGPATANNTRARTTNRTATGSSVPTIQVAAPSTTLRTYTAPSGVYKISYPSNWSVVQEGSTGVTIAPQGGVGDIGGRTEVVYGAMINHYDPFGSSGMTSSLRTNGSNSPYMGNVTLETATSDLLGQIRQQSPYLNTINNSTQQFNVSGGRALATALRGTDPSTGMNERVNVVTRQLEDGHLIYMLFVTPEQDASRYGPVLQAMVNSLQVSDTARH